MLQLKSVARHFTSVHNLFCLIHITYNVKLYSLSNEVSPS